MDKYECGPFMFLSVLFFSSPSFFNFHFRWEIQAMTANANISKPVEMPQG